MVSPLVGRSGSNILPEDAANAMEWHLPGFAFIPDHSGQESTMFSKCCADAGESALIQVSSAYYSKETLCGLLDSVYPKSLLVSKVSTSMLMTVLKIETERGSPW